jgi:tetratricopeptide (TPR) repeat protein
MRKLTHNERKELVSSMAEKLYPLYMEGDIEELGRISTEIITLHKHHVPALTFKGIYFRELGRYKNSLIFLEHATSLDPHDKFALVHLASVYNYFKRHVAAARTLEQALAEDIEDPQILLMRGDTLIKMEKNKEALECYLGAVKLDSSNVDYRIGKARAQRRLEDYVGAMDTLERILMVDENNAMALKEKGITLGVQGRYTDGMVCLNKALANEPNELSVHISQGEIFEKWDKYDEAFECFAHAETIQKSNIFVIAKKISTLYHLKDVESMRTEFGKLDLLFKEGLFEKIGTDGNVKYTEKRTKLMTELVQKAAHFLNESLKYDPEKTLYHYLQYHEFVDFFVFIIGQLQIASNEDRFVPEKTIRYDLKRVEDALNSRFMSFSMKKDLEYIDESPFIEEYKRCMIRLFRIFLWSLQASKKHEFSIEKKISIKEFNFIPIFWNSKDFEAKATEFFEWSNFKNYIQCLSEKYDDFFTTRFWEDIHNFISLLRENLDFRRRLKNYKKIGRFKEFNKRKMQERVIKYLPEHYLSSFDSDAQVLAFIDFEQMKEILSRSYYPKKHPNKLKFRNLLFYILEPENYVDSKGSIMLRNAESIKKDHEELKQIMLDEALQLRAFSYESKNTYTPNSKTDILEIVIDSFFWSPFKLKFEGFLVEKKIHFLIPSSHYSLMINLRIKTKKGNLYRKVGFQVHELKRGCMNFVDIFEENEVDRTITHLEKSGRIGLYVL